jgi:hypothetical protein
MVMFPISDEDLIDALEKDKCKIPPPGFIVCKECNGKKYIRKTLVNETYYWICCKNCNTTGSISWVQNVFKDGEL